MRHICKIPYFCLHIYIFCLELKLQPGLKYRYVYHRFYFLLWTPQIREAPTCSFTRNADKHARIFASVHTRLPYSPRDCLSLDIFSAGLRFLQCRSSVL